MDAEEPRGFLPPRCAFDDGAGSVTSQDAHGGNGNSDADSACGHDDVDAPRSPAAVPQDPGAAQLGRGRRAGGLPCPSPPRAIAPTMCPHSADATQAALGVPLVLHRLLQRLLLNTHQVPEGATLTVTLELGHAGVEYPWTPGVQTAALQKWALALETATGRASSRRSTAAARHGIKPRPDDAPSARALEGGWQEEHDFLYCLTDGRRVVQTTRHCDDAGDAILRVLHPPAPQAEAGAAGTDASRASSDGSSAGHAASSTLPPARAKPHRKRPRNTPHSAPARVVPARTESMRSSGQQALRGMAAVQRARGATHAAIEGLARLVGPAGATHLGAAAAPLVEHAGVDIGVHTCVHERALLTQTTVCAQAGSGVMDRAHIYDIAMTAAAARAVPAAAVPPVVLPFAVRKRQLKRYRLLGTPWAVHCVREMVGETLDDAERAFLCMPPSAISRLRIVYAEVPPAVPRGMRGHHRQQVWAARAATQGLVALMQFVGNRDITWRDTAWDTVDPSGAI